MCFWILFSCDTQGQFTLTSYRKQEGKWWIHSKFITSHCKGRLTKLHHPSYSCTISWFLQVILLWIRNNVSTLDMTWAEGILYEVLRILVCLHIWFLHHSISMDSYALVSTVQLNKSIFKGLTMVTWKGPQFGKCRYKLFIMPMERRPKLTELMSTRRGMKGPPFAWWYHDVNEVITAPK